MFPTAVPGYRLDYKDCIAFELNFFTGIKFKR